MPSIIVVGAGPAGCAAALRAARLPNTRVTLLEKRSFSMLCDARSSSRAYPMVLSSRATRLLIDELDLDLPAARQFYNGISFLPLGKVMQMSDPSRSRLVSRTELALQLIYAAAKDPRIALHFAARPVKIDFERQQLVIGSTTALRDDSEAVLRHFRNTGSGEHHAPAHSGERDAEVAGSVWALSPSNALLSIDAEALRRSGAPDSGLRDTHPGQVVFGTPRMEHASVMLGGGSGQAELARGHSKPGRSTGSDDHVQPGVSHASQQPDSHALDREDHSNGHPGGINTHTSGPDADRVGMPGFEEVVAKGYDLLLAADGAHSQIRGLATVAGLLSVQLLYTQSRQGYKTFQGIPLGQHFGDQRFPFAHAEVKPAQYLYFVQPQGKGARAEPRINLVLWRSSDQHISGMIAATDRAALQRPMALRTLCGLFGACVPEALLALILDEMKEQDASSFGENIACSRFHARGGVILLGDAAHTVTSSLGQGCNLALEGVRVLGELLEGSVVRSEMPLGAVPAAYTCRRRADAHALQQLELMSIIMRRGSGGLKLCGDSAGHVAHARITLGSAMLLGMAQWRLMPGKYRTVPMYDMLYDADMPYSKILTYVRRTALCVCFVIGATAVTTMLAVLQELQG